METISLNLIPVGAMPVCHTSQSDVGREIQCDLYEGSLAYHLQEGDELTLNILKPDGNNVTAIIPSEAGNSFVVISTVDVMCDVVGRNLCELRIKNGDKNIGTLNFYMMVEETVGEVEPLPPPTPVAVSPTIKGFYSKNANVVGGLNHTFEEGGTYQYIVLLRTGDAGTRVDPVIALNGDTITPNTDFSFMYDYFYYGEITVEAGDVITAEHTVAYSNSALQMIILKDIDINVFSVIGFLSNGAGSFNLPLGKWILQVYGCGYYQSNNHYSYRLEYHSIKDNHGSENIIKSIPCPSDSYYWYGFTYAITILGGE